MAGAIPARTTLVVGCGVSDHWTPGADRSAGAGERQLHLPAHPACIAACSPTTDLSPFQQQRRHRAAKRYPLLAMAQRLDMVLRHRPQMVIATSSANAAFGGRGSRWGLNLPGSLLQNSAFLIWLDHQLQRPRHRGQPGVRARRGAPGAQPDRVQAAVRAAQAPRQPLGHLQLRQGDRLLQPVLASSNPTTSGWTPVSSSPSWSRISPTSSSCG